MGHTNYNTIAYGDDSQTSVLRIQYTAESKQTRDGQGIVRGRLLLGSRVPLESG
jgi:hypothetical protein